MLSSLKLSRKAVQVTAHRLHTQAPCSDPVTGRRQRQPTLGLHLRNPSLMYYYSFNRPRRDGWLSWPCWLTDSGRFTHKVVTRPAVSLAQDRESSPARTGGLTTMLRHQLKSTQVQLGAILLPSNQCRIKTFESAVQCNIREFLQFFQQWRHYVVTCRSHRRRDTTRQFRLVGVGSVYWALNF